MGWTQEEIKNLQLKDESFAEKHKKKPRKVKTDVKGSQPGHPVNAAKMATAQPTTAPTSAPTTAPAQPQFQRPPERAAGQPGFAFQVQQAVEPKADPDVMVLVNQNSEKLLAAYKPVWWFLLVMGQMPFRIITRGSTESPIYNFRFSTVSLQTIIYGITFLAFSAFYLIITFAIAFFFFRGYTKVPFDTFPDPITRTVVIVPLEKFQTREELIPLVVTWALMTITFMGFIMVFLKGVKIVQYFNYWNSVVQIIDIDPTIGIRRYFIFQNLISGVIMLVYFGEFFLLGLWQGYPGPIFKLTVEFGNLVYGIIGEFQNYESKEQIAAMPSGNRLFLTLILISMTYGAIGSRVQIMPFVFYTQLLKNASQVWNERFRNLIKNTALKITKQSHRRVDYGNLLKDHLVLVQLFKMTENTFSITLISFYFVNFFCIILEVYFLGKILITPLTDPIHFQVVMWNKTLKNGQGGYQELSSEENKIATDGNYENENDKDLTDNAITFGIITILMAYQIFTTYQVTYQATQAYENAMAGFSVLRKHGFMHCKNKTERNFIHTLVLSFARNNPMMITGGGYFPLNNTLIITMAANLINFVVFMYQFKPDDWGDLEYTWNKEDEDA